MRKHLVLVALVGLAGCSGSIEAEGNSVDVVTAQSTAVTRSATFKTAVKGTFLCAENNGGGVVDANRTAASAWETFKLYDLNGGDLADGDMIWLAAGNGQYLSAEGGGGQNSVVNANRTNPLDWEIFIIHRVAGPGTIHDGDQVALQTKTMQTYLSALDGGGGNLVADRPVALDWEHFVIGGGNGGPVTPPPPPPTNGWKLVWSDEFDGAYGAIDGSKWTFDQGGSGWGNNELEYYTNRTDNVSKDGQGHLQIIAKPENYGGRGYTSGRINTSGHFTQAYGRFEASIKLPSGKGIWPAFWSLGNNIGNVGWPQCGELDIMEAVGDFSVNHGSAHGPGYSGGNPLTGTYKLPAGSLADGFHTYAIEWEPGQVRWYVDNVNYETRTTSDIPGGTQWVYDHPFFLILNVAVGGNWPGSPDGSTHWPQTMLVDYVRVYTR